MRSYSQDNLILILANKYPNFIEPNINVFTQQVTWSLADEGRECIVICPVALNYNKENYKLPFYREEISDSGKIIKVFHPKYIGYGQNGSLALKQRVRLTTYNYMRAAEKIIKHYVKHVNSKDYANLVIFAEFLCPAGVTAARLGLKYDIKAFMQYGEATYQGDRRYGDKYLSWVMQGLDGIIALSGQIKGYMLDSGIVNRNEADKKIIVIPSGYRKDRIYKRDKLEARDRLRLPRDKFIVGFCGAYGDRKGVLRLEKAVDAIEDPDVVLAACGIGSPEPTSDKLVLKGPIHHSELAWFYSAIDVFAFPTYQEGSCTAIVEAIACGCPIISSDRPFNYDICDESNSILIDPDDIEGMTESIIKLRDDKALFDRLSRGSIEKSKGLSLDAKAKKVLEFMNHR